MGRPLGRDRPVGPGRPASLPRRRRRWPPSTTTTSTGWWRSGSWCVDGPGRRARPAAGRGGPGGRLRRGHRCPGRPGGLRPERGRSDATVAGTSGPSSGRVGSCGPGARGPARAGRRSRALRTAVGAESGRPTRARVPGPVRRMGHHRGDRPTTTWPSCAVDTGHADAGGGWGGAPLHRAAVHSATSLSAGGHRGRRPDGVRYRYESWVRLGQTAPPRPRSTSSALAAELTAAETRRARGGCSTGPAPITGALHLVGEGAVSASTLSASSSRCDRRARLAGRRTARPGTL